MENIEVLVKRMELRTNDVIVIKCKSRVTDSTLNEIKEYYEKMFEDQKILVLDDSTDIEVIRKVDTEDIEALTESKYICLDCKSVSRTINDRASCVKCKGHVVPYNDTPPRGGQNP